MVNEKAEELAGRHWDDLPLDVRRVLVRRAQDELAWERVRKRVYRWSAFAGGALSLIIFLRNEAGQTLAQFFGWLSAVLGDRP